MNKDHNLYQEYQKNKQKEYESLCSRCGACCGSFEGDPCEHLIMDEEGKYYCNTYENRFGLKRSRNGREFLCVPIRKILSESWSGSWRCNYKKELRRIKD